MTYDRKQAEEYLIKKGYKPFKTLINGELVYPKLNREQVIDAMLDYHAQQLAEMIPDYDKCKIEAEVEADRLELITMRKAYIKGFTDCGDWLRSRLLNNK